MKSIQGFRGEGAALGSADGEVVGKESRLMKEHDEQIRRRKIEKSMEAETCSGKSSRSDSGDEEEDETGKLITIALKLPNKSVKKQFKTSYKVKVSKI